jgi:hypothetical protein
MERALTLRRFTVPNTLADLNQYSDTSIAYEDDRPYSVAFSPDTPVNPTVAVNEDLPFQHPVGTNIVENISAPGTMSYNIDLSSQSGNAILTWPTPLPATVSIVDPGSNVYSIIGVFTPETWDLIKSPTILVKDQGSNFTYTANIQYLDPANIANVAVKSWTVSANVVGSEELSAVSTWTYVKNNVATVDGTPEIVDVYSSNLSYTLTVTPSTVSPVSTLSSGGTGGTSNFNNSTKVLTITGTKTQVNSHLASIVFTPVTDTTQIFNLVYSLTNPISGLVTTRTQIINNAEAAFNINAVTYLEDTSKDLGYTIVDESATATSFTISVTQGSPSLSTNPGYFKLDGSNVGNVVTITGTKTQINTANIAYFPPIDWTANIELLVSQSKIDAGNTVVQNTNTPHMLFNAGTNPEIANMIPRSYTSNTINNIFATSTPELSDGPDQGQSYTITLSSALGKFGNSVANALAANSYSFTGNTTSVNSEFTNMVFVPVGAAQTGNLVYTQSRDGVSQVNTTQALTGTTGAFTGAATYTFTANTVWTPTDYEAAFYTDVKFILVGGGGGAVKMSGGGAPNSGGGAGGEVGQITKSRTGYTLSNSAHTITIGKGGAVRSAVFSGGLTNITANAGTQTAVVSSDYSMGADGGGGGTAAFDSSLPNPYINSRGGNLGGNTFTTGGTGANFGLAGGGAGAAGGGGSAVAQTSSGAGGAGITPPGGFGTFGRGGQGGQGVSSPTNPTLSGPNTGQGGYAASATGSPSAAGSAGRVVIVIS